MPIATNLTHADSPYVPASGVSLWLRCDTSGGDITVNGAASPTSHDVLIISNDINAGNVVTWTGSGDAITLQNGETLVARYDSQAVCYTPLAQFSVSPTYNSATIFALWTQAIYGPAGPGSGVEIGVVDSPGPGLIHIGPGDRDNPAIVFDQFMGPMAGLPVIRGGLRYDGLRLLFTDVTGRTRPLLLGDPIS